MTDIVGYKKRRQMMAGIRGKNTQPELIIRRALHRAGFRYRLHAGYLPGTPGLVFPRYNATIFIQGCFWHQHECHLFKWPKTRQEFWHSKIVGNKLRDEKNHAELQKTGWRILQIWECSLKGKYRLPLEKIINFSSSWLRSYDACASVQGIDLTEDAGGKGVS